MPYLIGEKKTMHKYAMSKIKDGLRFRVKLIVNYELVSQILSYGSKLKVIKPLSLQQQVKQELARSLKCYDA